MVKKILLLIAVVLTSFSAQAGVWVGETPAAGEWYLYSVSADQFITMSNGFPATTSDATAATLFTISGTSKTDFQYTQNGTTYYLYQSAGTYELYTTSVVSLGTSYAWDIDVYNSGYRIHSNHKYSWRRHQSDTNRYITVVGADKNCSCSKNEAEYNTDNAVFLFISKAQYESNDAEDLTSEMPDTWVGATGTWNGGAERYNGDSTPFPVGNVLTQTVENLENGYYEVQIYAFENWADWDASANIAYGEGICEAFANDAKYSLTSIKSKGDRAFDNNTLVKMICQVTDGTLTYGLRNIAEGGNWAVCKAKSLTFLGDTKANIAVNSAAQYGTFCAPFDVTLPEGVTACTIDGVDGDALAMTAVEGVVPANTPVVLNGSLVATALYGNAVDGTPEEGVLVGVYEDTAAPLGSYVLQNQSGVVGFYKVETAGIATVPANRAYLNVASDARFFGFDGETAISAVDALTSGKAQIFDLQGRRLNSLQKGINIVNGVKVLVK